MLLFEFLLKSTIPASLMEKQAEATTSTAQIELKNQN